MRKRERNWTLATDFKDEEPKGCPRKLTETRISSEKSGWNNNTKEFRQEEEL